jgi:hypothetical protein
MAAMERKLIYPTQENRLHTAAFTKQVAACIIIRDLN